MDAFWSPLHQCHCGAEAFGFLVPVNEVLVVGLLIVRDGRRGGGGGAGGFGALVFKFPVCKVAVLFEVDTRDWTVAWMPSFFFVLEMVSTAGSPTLELKIFLGGRLTELDLCLPDTCKSILLDLVDWLSNAEGPFSLLLLLLASSLLLLAVFGVTAFLGLATVVASLFGWATVGLALLGVFASVFRTISLVIVRRSPVEGRRTEEISACFAALSLLMGRLSEVEGRRGVVTLACFCAWSRVTGRLSAVEGRCGVETSASVFEFVFAMGRRSPVEGRCAPAEEGLLRPVSLLLSGVPAIFCGAAAFGLCTGLVFWSILVLGFTEPGLSLANV
jgi:hypothetical protein